MLVKPSCPAAVWYHGGRTGGEALNPLNLVPLLTIGLAVILHGLSPGPAPHSDWQNLPDPVSRAIARYAEGLGWLLHTPAVRFLSIVYGALAVGICFYAMLL